MPTAKESIEKHKLGNGLCDELLRELAFKRMIDTGLKDVDKRNTITNK